MAILLFIFLIVSNNLLAVPVTKVPEPKIPPSLKKYICYRAFEPIKVDGLLSEPSWAKADWTDDFVDIEGSLKPLPRFRTRAKMLWDDRYFYVGAEFEEPHIWATLTQRDSVIFQDNDFEVFIDPDGDTHNYYELELNALGTVWDLLLVKPYRDGGPAVHAWDIQGLEAAVSTNGTLNNPLDKDKGWSVEIAFPLGVLKECLPGKKLPKPGDQWRVNFSRVEYKVDVINGKYEKVKDAVSGKPLPEDNWVWSPAGLINIHYPEMWGYIQFSGETAGSKKDVFEERSEEKVKWSLRQIYYKEWAYKADHNHFPDKLEDLGLKDLKIEDWLWPPLIQTTDSLFEAIYKNEAGECWHIQQDGLVWKDVLNCLHAILCLRRRKASKIRAFILNCFDPGFIE